MTLSRFLKAPSDYEKVRLLGKGGAGEVWLCKDRATGAEVAVKQLHTLSDSRDSQLFLREVVIPMRMSIPGVVGLVGFHFPERIDVDSGETDAMIVTEYVKNGSLECVMRAIRESGPIAGFGPTEMSKCIFGIAATMLQLHSKGVIHRDLNLSNIFLDDNFEPRIGDFGLSRMCHSTLTMTMAVGTPVFMAPELVSEDYDAPYSQSVDIYAFAVLMYRMFTPNLELSDNSPARNPQQMMIRIMRGARFKKVPEVPDCFWALIQRCWAQSPSERPTFRAIVDAFKGDDRIVVAGTNMANYKEYQARVMNTNVSKASRNRKDTAHSKVRRYDFTRLKYCQA